MDALEKALGIDFDLYSAAICWGLIFTRTFVMIQLTPFLGGKGVPGRVRVVLSAALSTFVYVLYQETMLKELPDDKGLLIALFFKEIFFGLAIGLTTIMCFYAIDAGGRIIDNQRGSANAQLFVPQLGQVSIFGLFEFWLAMAVFIALSGHVTFLRTFIGSFATVPVLKLPSIAPGLSPFAQHVIRMSADVLILGMQLSAPVLIAIFLTDLVLGIANKMAPQIPVFELGFMLKGYVGVMMVWVAVFLIVAQMGNFFDLMQNNLERIIRLFSG